MARKMYYSDYAQRSLRFFSRREKPDTFPSVAEEKNWNACEAALATLSDYDRELTMAIYVNPDTLADNIYGLSLEKKMPQERLWSLVSKVEKQFAIERGLI